jgi:DNA-binding HxlR family transcriptional regulator
VKQPDISGGAGRFAYEGLDRVIHEKARLGILTSLVTNRDGVRFIELKELCSLTDGNLNRHLQHLQEAGLVDVRKVGSGRRASTIVRITELGRRRFTEYLNVLESVVIDAARAGQPASSKSKIAWRTA